VSSNLNVFTYYEGGINTYAERGCFYQVNGGSAVEVTEQVVTSCGDDWAICVQ
jgi:hypothetical protein